MNNILNTKIAGDQSQFPGITDKNRVTSFADMEQDLKILQANKDKWVATSIDDRVKILDKIRRDLKPLSGQWLALSMEAKGIAPNTFAEQEEKIFLGSVFGLLGSYRKSLADIRKYGRPQVDGPVIVLPNGQVAVKVFPQAKSDTMLFPGVSAEVWMEPGIALDETIQSQAQIYREKNVRGAVNLVLGAGNLSCLPISDIL
jgi:hypothetical protein